MSGEISSLVKKWQEVLDSRGYENRIKHRKAFTHLTRLSRTWKYILQASNLGPSASVFEFGCGGGNQLVPLAIRGYKCSGIDCSEEVLVRCKHFVSEVETFIGKSLGIQLICGDFLSFTSEDKYDLVFNFGVIEHFIDDHEREIAVQKMFTLCKPGGYVVSVVPSGKHPMRERMRKDGLGGYLIPEIDYDSELMTREMAKAGAEEVRVIPYNLFGHLMIKPSPPIIRLMRKVYYYMWQLLPPSFLPLRFISRYAFGLIGIAQKPHRFEDWRSMANP